MSKTQFNKLILPLADRMYRYSMSILHNQVLAEDVVQESLLKIWNKRHTLNTINDCEAWVMRIIRNGSLDQIKRDRYTTLEDKHETRMYVNTGDTMVYQDQQKWYREAIDQLPAKQREIFHLREVEEKTYQEIADILGVQESMVKVNLHRARKKIRETIERIEAYGINRNIAG